MNFLKNIFKLRYVRIFLVLIELVLIIIDAYCFFKLHNRFLIMAFSTALVIIGILNIMIGKFVKTVGDELSNCVRYVKIIDSIIEITALNYFYAKKYHMKFDQNKIEKELDQDELQLIYVPDMFDEEPTTDEDIAKSITFMKDWNLGIVHRILLTSLSKGFISGEQRKILLEHALTCINNIDDKSFIIRKNGIDNEYYTLSYVFGDDGREVRYS